MTRKKRIFSALGFLLFTFSYLFYTGAVKKEFVQPPTIPAPDKFLYGAINTIDDGSNNYNNYDDLGLNLWHTYVGTEKGKEENSTASCAAVKVILLFFKGA